MLIILTIFTVNNRYYIIITSEDNKVFYKCRTFIGDEFDVGFIHSVNKTPLTDYYRVESDGIYVIKTLYYSFGAGVQTALDEGQTITYTDDGGFLVEGFHKKIDNLDYVVGMVSDHILHINNESISLRDLCGKGTYIQIRLRHSNCIKEVLKFE